MMEALLLSHIVGLFRYCCSSRIMQLIPQQDNEKTPAVLIKSINQTFSWQPEHIEQLIPLNSLPASVRGAQATRVDTYLQHCHNTNIPMIDLQLFNQNSFPNKKSPSVWATWAHLLSQNKCLRHDQGQAVRLMSPFPQSSWLSHLCAGEAPTEQRGAVTKRLPVVPPSHWRSAGALVLYMCTARKSF